MKNEFFVCACYSDEHSLRFTISEEPVMLDVSVFLNHPNSIWKRIWIGIKYIFGYKCKYGHWDDFILREEDLPRLQELLEDYGELLEKEKANAE